MPLKQSFKKHKDAQEAFRELVMQFGVEEMATMLGMPTGTLYNKINPNESSHHKATLADVITASIISDDRRVLHAFAHLMGEVCYRLPDMSDLATEDLMNHLLTINVAGGDFFSDIQQALQGDRRIDGTEYLGIQKDGEAFVAAILEALQRMREMSQQ